MAPRTRQGKRQYRRLPLRPGRDSRVERCTAAVTVAEKAKVDKVATEVFKVRESELLYFRSVHQCIRIHDEVYGSDD